ncbi:hypothetical protein [Lachnospira eligens]|jgi:cytoskeletal protein RodZ|uniref:SH3 domain-containing protein n=1 Tax=Lachnospira eligens TaxID=39485 RepID=A0A414DDB7_9FIRM|nr:hypothetical protein [Lachnospira eligens]RHA51519.1 hypothetical protein DW933_01630 [Lachnospira eligens]RHC12526.1 hypothetical protein DW858_09145 [Lachnospira eligens]RHD08624.1 hypothetical protein DW811_07775 [Lachnospira eligens]RHK57429.1 hypothetical protein DW057_00120 [Lachnospira eligens]RHK88395.1 hypothetical protein DW044_02995 [Lachnospira eligens]
MKINNLIVKIFLGIYLVIIISGIVIFENIGFAGGGLEKSIHTASNSETQPVTVKDISSETVSRTTPAATVKETASSQDVTKQEAVTNTQTAAVASETTSKSSESETTQTEPETTQTEVQSTQPETVAQPSYTFANGRITNTSALKSYRVTGASYVNMHKDKNGSHSFAVVPGGTTGSISSVGAYYTLIDYNGTSGYVYNSYLEVY